MNFVKHFNLIGKHAFLGASNYHWINYDKEKLIKTYNNFLAKQRGTELHDFACTCIKLRQKLPRSKRTLNSYVNDAIGFRMTPEQPLYYSDNCFGTADAIAFDNDFLRIHDLKTGETPASMSQLKIYSALFCLEYRYEPKDIQIELRIYQLDDVQIEVPDPNEIKDIMKKIIEFDREIDLLRSEAEL